jgi:glycolate oxidase iron-sulfur subunit
MSAMRTGGEDGAAVREPAGGWDDAPAPRGFAGPDRPGEDILLRCVRCGLCLPHCPTYLETRRETSSPRGRIHLIQAVAEGRLDVADPAFVDQMYECLDCRACQDVCPSGVEYGQLVETARAQIERARPRPLWQRAVRAAALGGLFGDMGRFRLAGRALRLYQRSGLRRLARAGGALRRLGLDEAEALLPELPGSFVTPGGEIYPATGHGRRGRVALFAGCVMSTVFAATDRATVRVLAANGYEVVAPAGQGCCGALAVHAGELERARAAARRNIAAFTGSRADVVAVNAAGCGAELKEYGQLLAGDPEWAGRAEDFAGRVRDVTELLGGLEAAGELNTAFEPLPLRVTYQEPCHLAHAQRITQQPRRLLSAIPGLELVEMEEPKLCCGSAGVYNLTRPEMAGRLGSRKLEHIVATGAEVVVTANPGCHLQLRAGLARAGSSTRVVHIVDVLDAAYRGIMPD